MCPGGVHDLQHHVPERDALAVGQRPDGEVGRRRRAVADPGAGGLGQLQVSGDEVGVEVGVDDSDDAQPVLAGLLQVHLDVAARVDHHRLPGAGVPDQVGGLGQAVEVVLREVHVGS